MKNKKNVSINNNFINSHIKDSNKNYKAFKTHKHLNIFKNKFKRRRNTTYQQDIIKNKYLTFFMKFYSKNKINKLIGSSFQTQVIIIKFLKSITITLKQQNQH